MRKPVVFIVTITLSSLLYVHLQINLYKVSYQIKNNEKIVDVLIDQNQLLKYNVASLKCPDSLESVMLAKNIELYHIDNVEFLRVNTRKVPLTQKKKDNRIVSAFLKMFSIKRTAVADSIE